MSVAKYLKQISEQEGADQRAEKLAEFDAAVEGNKGRLFVMLNISEFSEPEVLSYSSRGRNRTSGFRLYRASCSVYTGVVEGMCYQRGNVVLKGDDQFEWRSLSLYNGPKKEKHGVSLELDYERCGVIDIDDGAVLWNGRIPLAYTEWLGISSPMGRGHYAPQSLIPNEFRSSTAIVIGNKLVLESFGLGGEVTGTESLYKEMLASEGLDVEGILAKWSPDKSLSGDQRGGTDVFRRLEERIMNLPETFFRERLMSMIGIEEYQPPKSSDEILRELEEITAELGDL